MKNMKGMKGDESMEFSELSNKVIMKLAKIKQGFLINFNVHKLKQGLKSFVL